MSSQRPNTIFWHLIYSLLLLNISSYSLALPDDFPRLKFRHYNIEDGLSNNLITCFAEDQQGFVWIGTHNGLNRFDGRTFRVYQPDPLNANSISNNIIVSVQVSSGGLILLGVFNKGMDILDPENDSFFHFGKTGRAFKLPTDNVNCFILPDSLLWIGTDHGLFKFSVKRDKNRLLVFAPISIQFPDIQVNCITNDRFGNLWVGTTDGLFCINQRGEISARYRNDSNVNSLSNSQITSIKVDFNGYLWVGTSLGLNKSKKPIQPNSDKLSFDHFFLGNWQKRGMVNIIAQNSPDQLWVGSYDGAFQFDLSNPEKITWVQRFKALKEPALALTNSINNISFDVKGNVWISFSLYSDIGIGFFNNQTKTEHRYLPSTDDIYSYSSNPSALFVDSKNCLWVGKVKNGFSIADIYNKGFETIRLKDVYAISKWRNNLWIGSEQGLYISTSDHSSIQWLYQQPIKGGLPKGKTIGTIEPVDDSQIWVGFLDYKISIFNPVSKAFNHFVFQQGYSDPFPGWSVRTIKKDSQGMIWIATSSTGLFRYTASKNIFEHIRLKIDENPDNKDLIINCLAFSHDRAIWVGTNKYGLFKLAPDGKTIWRIPQNDGTPKSLPAFDIYDILEDHHGNVWLGTYGGGLCRINHNDSSITTFTTGNGLPNNIILRLLIDAKGHIWGSTNMGIFRFDPVSMTSKNFTSDDWLQSNEFNIGAAFRDSSSGFLYFGGINGINYIDPDNISENKIPPTTVITGIRLFNKPINVGDTVNNQVILNQCINYTKSLTFNHKNNVITFEFASLHFANPNKNHYKVWLHGFDNTWSYLPNDRPYATYTNLNKGHYTLEVRSANSDLVWDEIGAKLELIILPAWWETFWFKLIAFVAVFISISGWFVWRLFQHKKQNALLEKRINERTIALVKANQELIGQKKEIIEINQKLHEADQSKINFFTNISHEFRTPLTLIIGPIEALLNRANSLSGHDKIQLQLIDRNARKLKHLVNQLLELRKADSGSLPLKVQNADLVDFTGHLVDSFQPVSQRFKINTRFEQYAANIKAYFDADILDKILTNLLSNAYKYTPENGNIWIILQCIGGQSAIEKYALDAEAVNNHYAEFIISDSGIGIEPEQQTKIFERYYRIENHEQKPKEGFGIGLALTRELVQLHHGRIKVSSQPGKGSSFMFCIPCNKEPYIGQIFEMEEASKANVTNQSERDDLIRITNPDEPITVAGSDSPENPLLLIIDDNPDIIAFLKLNLTVEYRVIEATNGEEALELAFSTMPDLIISDIMMPKLSGTELCRTLKLDERTSHIPILLLTAITDDNKQIEGFETGADAYITKPFNMQILRSNITSIFENRRKLQAYFSKPKSKIPVGLNVSPIDRKFMDRLLESIYSHLDDNNFDGDQLAVEANMSKGNLYRKLKNITGLSVNIFIRNIRLEMALELLNSNEYNVSEVAYKVGFNDPHYFSTCFSNYFGKSPSKSKDKLQ